MNIQCLLRLDRGYLMWYIMIYVLWYIMILLCTWYPIERENKSKAGIPRDDGKI